MKRELWRLKRVKGSYELVLKKRRGLLLIYFDVFEE
jgi:hypothetical protein